jgi:hypothetical protein
MFKKWTFFQIFPLLRLNFDSTVSPYIAMRVVEPARMRVESSRRRVGPTRSLVRLQCHAEC